MSVTPFHCDACREWIPHKPEMNLFGEIAKEKIVIGGICTKCCNDGWDYDHDSQVVLYEDEL
jgi:hypothetical protein